MDQARQITIHRSQATTDVNNKIAVSALSPNLYAAAAESGDGGQVLMSLPFAGAGKPGLTNEVLLAVVYDRLNEFQQTATKCDENTAAMAHVSAALHHLKRRTARRADAGIEGTMTEEPVKAAETKKADPDQRIKLLNADVVFHTKKPDGSPLMTCVPVANLQSSWAKWDTVVGLVRPLDPPATAVEMGVLEAVASTPAAKNGLTELKSALANTRRA